MYGKLKSMRGVTCVRVSGDMPQRFLNCCAGGVSEIYDVRRADDFTLELSVNSREIDALAAAAVKSCCEIEILSRRGGKKFFNIMRLRLFPLLLAAVFVTLLFWSKFYVWEIRVVGCENVSEARVMDVLSDCGVKSGAFWPDFSADSIRSRVLSSVPELGWISVNMHGSLAEAVVVERKEPPEMLYSGDSAHITASHGGFITKVDALVGQSAVSRGDTVNRGDVLISGVVESSFSPPRFVRALGSVSAEINSELNAVAPQNVSAREYTGKIKRKFALIIGNYRINFYSGSSISHGFCDKIISVWKAEAEGLFSLPLSLVCEKEYYYDAVPCTADESRAGVYMEATLRQCFGSSFEISELLSEKLSFGTHDGLYTASLRTRCICDIGVPTAVSEAERALALANFEKADDE